ncbi:amidohydrolase family protein [Halorientalis sp.]|uniref:amidohydrolase family protein n=1 Tax=Halorientalis sp. TaxID=1931229 RepID=UPI00261990DF|nr:amidohydrolase family protein [Halorientalis sp.]
MIINNASIITASQSTSVDKYIQNGSIVIEGDKIESVQKDNRATVDDHEVIDADGMAAIPGLINGHNHFEQSFMQSAVRLYDGDTAEWIQEFKIPLTEEMTRDDYYLSNKLACLNLIQSGVTCSVNHICQQDPEKLESFGIDQSVRAATEAGVRVVMPIGLAGKNEPAHYIVDNDRYEELLETTYQKWHGSANGKIRIWAGPTGFYSATEEMWKTASEFATEATTGLHTHIATFETGDIEKAKQEGVLDENFVGAHCVWVDEQDIADIAESECKIVHNPVYKLGYTVDSDVHAFGDGIAPIFDLCKSGCTVGLGQDGCMGNTQDLFKEMRMLALTQHHKYERKDIFPPAKLLEMATIENARAVSWENDIGSIEPGKKADIALVNLDKPKFASNANLPASIVYQASAADVSTVIADGTVLMRDRQVQTIDEEETLAEARDAIPELFHRAGLEEYLQRGVEPWDASLILS